MFSGEESSQMGISIYSFPLGGNTTSLELEQGTDGYQYIAQIETITTEDEVKLATISTACSLRIRWDAANTMLYSDYDSNGGADNWTNLASWNIGTGQPYSWGMESGDTFMCVLLGGAETNHEGEANPSGDNFVAISTPPAAPLAIFRPSTGLWALRNITRSYFGGSNDRSHSHLPTRSLSISLAVLPFLMSRDKNQSPAVRLSLPECNRSGPGQRN